MSRPNYTAITSKRDDDQAATIEPREHFGQ